MSRQTLSHQVYIYESEYRQIYAATREFLTEETGGDLYGTFTHGGMPVIWLASGPGPRVVRNRVHFAQDTSFTTDWQRRLMQQFGIQYIGSWHSHHSLGLNQPSSGDRDAARTYAINHNRPRTLEIIVTYEHGNETALWFYYYTDATQGILQRAQHVLLPGVSPLRQRLDAQGEREFSGNTDWRRGHLPSGASTSTSIPSSPGASAGGSQRSGSVVEPEVDEMAVGIPAGLNDEIEGVSSWLEDIQVDSNPVIVSLGLDGDWTVDISVDMRSLAVQKVEWVSKQQGKRQEITDVVRKLIPSLSITRNSRVLKKIYQAMPEIHQQMKMESDEWEEQNAAAEQHKREERATTQAREAIQGEADTQMTQQREMDERIAAQQREMDERIAAQQREMDKRIAAQQQAPEQSAASQQQQPTPRQFVNPTEPVLPVSRDEVALAITLDNAGRYAIVIRTCRKEIDDQIFSLLKKNRVEKIDVLKKSNSSFVECIMFTELDNVRQIMMAIARVFPQVSIETSLEISASLRQQPSRQEMKEEQGGKKGFFGLF